MEGNGRGIISVDIPKPIGTTEVPVEIGNRMFP
jgi:hypothetical protein